MLGGLLLLLAEGRWGNANATQEKKRSNVSFYCDNPLKLCTHNRNQPTYNVGNGGVKHYYEVAADGADPYKNAGTAPPVVCGECAAAGFPGMMMTRKTRAKKNERSHSGVCVGCGPVSTVLPPWCVCWLWSCFHRTAPLVCVLAVQNARVGGACVL